jgi:glucose-1-phosphate adenylyltransferase
MTDRGSPSTGFETHRDVLGTEPGFGVLNAEWPIFSGTRQGPVARVLGGAMGNRLLGRAPAMRSRL